jgi:predicted dehydrogenase
MGMSPTVAIIGAGMIGQKRAANLGGASLVACCDSVLARAEAITSRHPGAVASTDWKAVVARPDIDIVIISVTHDILPVIGAAAAANGKHVLIEKPAARRAAELDPMAAAAKATGALVRIGFNHRYHRAFQKARAIFDSGVLGEPYLVRGRYGHGGRIGYESEWRAVPDVSGGGEAIDQGVHLIDLARWFLGDFPTVQGCVRTFFWNMPVEDNAFFLLQTATGCVASLHASWTEWKNLFSFEFFCRNGKLEVSGLGGSYGIESLRHYQMSPEMGPPETAIYEYPMADDSWEQEFRAFLDDIRLKRQPQPGIVDAQAALRIVEQVYKEKQP